MPNEIVVACMSGGRILIGIRGTPRPYIYPVSLGYYINSGRMIRRGIRAGVMWAE